MAGRIFRGVAFSEPHGNRLVTSLVGEWAVTSVYQYEISHCLFFLSFVQSIRHKIIYYYKPDQDSADSYELFSSLPADRELLLRNRSDLASCRELYAMMQNDR